MLIEEKVYALLRGDAGVSALVPGSRIKPPGDWQNIGKNYIVHFPVAPEVIPLHDADDQRAPLTAWSYQVSCFGDSYGAARRISAAVVAALSGQHDGVTFRWAGQTAMFESDVRVHQIALEFDAWEALSADVAVTSGGVDAVPDWDAVPSVDAIPS